MIDSKLLIKLRLYKTKIILILDFIFPFIISKEKLESVSKNEFNKWKEAFLDKFQ